MDDDEIYRKATPDLGLGTALVFAIVIVAGLTFARAPWTVDDIADKSRPKTTVSSSMSLTTPQPVIPVVHR